MAKQNEKALGAINYLASQLGVNLNDQRIAIATDTESAKVRMHDGSLEAMIEPHRMRVYVESPRARGIIIQLVDHNKNLAPEGAVYEIMVYKHDDVDNCDEILNGDVLNVYVGRDGLILSEAGRHRAAELLKK